MSWRRVRMQRTAWLNGQRYGRCQSWCSRVLSGCMIMPSNCFPGSPTNSDASPCISVIQFSEAVVFFARAVRNGCAGLVRRFWSVVDSLVNVSLAYRLFPVCLLSPSCCSPGVSTNPGKNIVMRRHPPGRILHKNYVLPYRRRNKMWCFMRSVCRRMLHFGSFAMVLVASTKILPTSIAIPLAY